MIEALCVRACACVSVCVCVSVFSGSEGVRFKLKNYTVIVPISLKGKRSSSVMRSFKSMSSRSSRLSTSLSVLLSSVIAIRYSTSFLLRTHRHTHTHTHTHTHLKMMSRQIKTYSYTTCNV